MQPGPSEEERLGQILDELVAQARRGATPEVEKRCTENPDIADQIRDLFSTLYFMEENKPVAEVAAHEATTPEIVQQANSTIGGYLIVREIARGGMGIVYEAVQLSLQRRVALKVISRHLLQDAKSIERFRREARLASQLHHSNIVPVFDVGEEGEVGYYAMQFISGQSLDQVIREMACLSEDGSFTSKFQYSEFGTEIASQNGDETTALTTDRGSEFSIKQSSTDTRTSTTSKKHPVLYRNAARIALQIAEALAYAHQRGILHRDIKPSNILIDSEGNAWVTDFGLARFDDSSGHDDPSLTKTGDIVGTLKYLAPERLRGQHDHRCDIYGLAATLYELILGRPLFQAIDRIHLVDLVTNQEPTRPSSSDRRIPRDLETIILKGLSKEPDKRYQSAQKMADDLRLFLLDRPIQARRVTWMEQTLSWCRRNRAVTGLAIVLLIAVAILTTFFAINRTLTSERDLATTARNTAIELLDRARQAEQAAAVRAAVNDITAYRMTREPELTRQMDRLKEVSAADLSPDLQGHVRNELISCLLRDDWYTSSLPIDRPAIDVAFDSQHGRICTLNEAGELELSDLKTGASLAKSKPTFPFRSLHFSPGREYLILLAPGNTWSIVRARDLTEVETSPRSAAGCFVSDSSQRMAFWHSNLITVEKMEPGADQRVLLQHPTEEFIEAVDISHDGRFVAYREFNKLVVVEVESGKILNQRRIEGGFSVAFSPDGRWLATSDDTGRLLVLEASTLEPRVKTTSFNDQIFKICWDQDSRLIVLQTWGRLTAVVNPWTQETLVRSRKPLDDHQIMFRDGNLGYRYQNGTLTLLNWRTGLAQDISSGPLRLMELLVQVAIHPELPIMVGHTPDRFLWFEFPSGRLLFESNGIHPLTCRFSEDGKRLVMIDQLMVQNWQIEKNVDSGVIAIRAENWNKHQLSEDQLSSSLSTVYIKPDLQSAIVTTPTEKIGELDFQTGKLTRTYDEAMNGELTPLGDGQVCGVHSWLRNYMTILDTKSGKVLGQLDTGLYSRIFADPDLKTIATTNEKYVEFWTYEPLARTGQKIPHPVQHGQVVWHPKGKHLVTQTESSVLDIRSVETLDSVGQLQTSPDVVYTQMQFSAHGHHLVGVAGTGTIRVWHLTSLRERLQEWGLDWESPNEREDKTSELSANESRSRHWRLNSGQPWKFDLTEAETYSDLKASITADRARAIRLQNSSDEYGAHLAWSLLQANRSLEEAIEAELLAKSVVERIPDNPAYRNTLGLAYYRVGKFEEAREILERNYQNRFGTKNAIFDAVVLALVHKKLGNDALAEKYLRITDQIRFDATDISTIWIEQLNRLRFEY